MRSEFFDLIQQKTGFTLEWELFKTSSSIDEQANLLMASGTSPNLIQGITPSWAGQAAKEGGLAYIDDDLPKYPFLSEFMTPNFRSYCTVNGKMYVFFFRDNGITIYRRHGKTGRIQYAYIGDEGENR
jgi:ABC-type glycerol-3-phosphate transport system substrate-binding protein